VAGPPSYPHTYSPKQLGEVWGKSDELLFFSKPFLFSRDDDDDAKRARSGICGVSVNPSFLRTAFPLVLIIVSVEVTVIFIFEIINVRLRVEIKPTTRKTFRRPLSLRHPRQARKTQRPESEDVEAHFILSVRGHEIVGNSLDSKATTRICFLSLR